MPSPRGVCDRCAGPTRTTRNHLCWSCFTSRSTLAERFWDKVDLSAGLFECWPWTGATQGRGYGAFKGVEGRVVPASRFALELAIGRPLTPTEQACHSCDNPPCVNPAHLFVGTASDNARDMVAKHRHAAAVHPETVARGEQSGAARLTADVVERIRDRRRQGASFPRLAAEFGIAISHAHRIVSGESWAHTIEGVAS